MRLDKREAALTREVHPIGQFEWSPDGKRIAYLVSLPSARRSNEPTIEGVNNLPRNQIKVVDVATGTASAVTATEHLRLGDSQRLPRWILVVAGFAAHRLHAPPTRTPW